MRANELVTLGLFFNYNEAHINSPYLELMIIYDGFIYIKSRHKFTKAVYTFDILC